jgi:hypothetical protein
LGPDETAVLKPLGQQAQAIAGPPQHGDHVAALATEHEHVAAVIDVELARQARYQGALDERPGYNFTLEAGAVPPAGTAFARCSDWLRCPGKVDHSKVKCDVS